MDEPQETNTAEQHKKQYDWLKGYAFVKGVSGNPSGRPKGVKSLKQFAKEYLETLPPDEKIEYLKTLPTEIVWKMAEGNPDNKTDLHANVKLTMADVLKRRKDENLARRITGQVVSDERALLNPQQETAVSPVQPEQSPAAFQPTQVVEKFNPEEQAAGV